MRRVAALVEREKGPLVVVASALFGITDLLLEGAKRSAAGEAAAGARAAARFLDRHRALVRELVKQKRAHHDLLLLVDTAAREYRDLCRAVVSLRDLAPRTLDLMLARGERASSAVLAAVLAETGRRARIRGRGRVRGHRRPLRAGHPRLRGHAREGGRACCARCCARAWCPW